MWKQLRNFFERDLWRIQLEGQSGIRAFLIQLLRVVFTAVHHFQLDRCAAMASSLTFFSLLSIVPVLAAAFGVAKGFGFEETLQLRLMSSFAEQREVLEPAIGYANTLLEETKGGLIAGVGVLFLLWSVVKLIGHIESAFNVIWKVRKSRSLGRRFSDYLALIIVCPVFFTVASSITVFLASQVESVQNGSSWLSTVSPVLAAFVTFLPYLLIWAMLTFLYLFLPNTKTPFVPGLLAGILTGTGYQLLQWVYIKFQIGVATYGAIYGSFAALPLFLIWLQMSWMLVLGGAEICVASQNLADFEFRHDCSRASHAFQGLISLLIMHQVIRIFVAGGNPPGMQDLSDHLKIPQRLLRDQLSTLVETGLLAETKPGRNGDLAYLPGRPVGQLTITKVLSTLDHAGSDSIPVVDSASFRSLKSAMENMADALTQHDDNQLLRDID